MKKNQENRNLLIQAWNIFVFRDQYYLPYTHYIYLKEIVPLYQQVGLLSAVNEISEYETNHFCKLNEFNNVKVHALPPCKNYVSSLKNFNRYKSLYNSISNQYNQVYVRYPTPFGWLCMLNFKPKNRIIHFVGSPFNATWHNPNFTILKKLVLNALFVPEHFLYTLACKNANVYTNGFHIKKALKKWNVHANALISSTLNDADFLESVKAEINYQSPKFLYIGYLRKAKGIETLIKAFSVVKKSYSGAILTIVGDGEYKESLKNLSSSLNLNDSIIFAGHVDDRDSLNNYYRTHDIFCFASLSEGSPRVILEAMANKIHIISTPVGALPQIFTDGIDINFAEFNDHIDFSNSMLSILINEKKFNAIKDSAYQKAKGYTLRKFIHTLFNYET